jgi:hypothetical protein
MSRGGAGRRIRAQRWYRLLVLLYPASHRRAFGEQMVQAFGDHYRDAVGGGRVGRFAFWRSVLADAGRSLLVEYLAVVRAGVRRPGRRATPPPRCRSPRRPTPRPWRAVRRVRRGLRYRRPGWRPERVIASTRRYRLVYRGRLPALVPLAVLLGAVLAGGIVAGRTGLAAVAAGVVLAIWLAYRIRLARSVPAGPPGDGPAPPGGAAVREPRRPLPMSPAGSAARPRGDEDPPGRAVALI